MRVRLDWHGSDRSATLSVAPGQTILDAARAADLGLPFGCRTGACGTCMARLLDGRVTHRRPPRALTDRQLEDGYVLTCVATPTTDAHLEVGAGVQADLFADPWR